MFNCYGVELVEKCAYIEWIGGNDLTQSVRNSYSFIGTYEKCVEYAKEKECSKIIGNKKE